MEKERLLLIAGIVFALLVLFFGWCYTKKSPRVHWSAGGSFCGVYPVVSYPGLAGRGLWLQYDLSR